ncbi:MAG TPA: ribonuclease Z, partial [Syntrophobacteraceae bacterium]|nr:ribonuclease Z [Syntrophobacteraceae bacterium]
MASDLHCFLLGTGGMMPMPERMLTSLAVRLGGRTYLFDAGEGTQVSWKRLRLGLRGFEVLALSHLHADHCLGVPGMMMLRAQMDFPGPLTVLGPPGTRSFLRDLQSNLDYHLNYPVLVREWETEAGETAYEDPWVRILWRPLEHTRFCLGYRIEEPQRPGRFDPLAARALGVPEGPLWGMLQRGRPVLNEAGESVYPEQVLGPPRRGRSVAYVTDTLPGPNALTLCRDADLAFVEGMFLAEDADHARAKEHMTVDQGAQLGLEAGARLTVLIHLSPRYNGRDRDRLESAVRPHGNRVRVGRDLESYPV